MEFLFLLIVFAAFVMSQKYELVVENFQVGLFSGAAIEPTNGFIDLKESGKVNQIIKLDTQKRLQITFAVKNKQTNKPVLIHQAFVLFLHKESKHEVIFIASVDKKNGNLYTFNLKIKSQLKDFNGVSGKYIAYLILGDVLATNPVKWHFADILIDVPEVVPKPIPKSKRIVYEKLPEIKHKFAQPESRPPQILSDTFAALCALPLVILFILWLRVGLNFGNLQFSLWALCFHVGLGSIFGLYFLYWIRLNMFETLKYLCILGAFTFICGNRFLHNFNQSKKQKLE